MAQYTPELVRYLDYKKPRSQKWGGSLKLAGLNAGMARKTNPIGISFNKLQPYAWGFWVKFDENDTRANTLVRLGTPNTNGYRIIKTQSGGKNLISLQEFKTFTATTFQYPVDFDITKWHFVVIQWIPSSSTFVTVTCYINGVEIRTKTANITWANVVNTTTDSLIIGSDYNVETLGGYINYLGLWNRNLIPDDIFKCMWKKNYSGVIGMWRCDENGGTTLYDRVGQNNLSLIAPAKFKIQNQSFPPLAGANFDPTKYTLVDSNMGFGYGNDAQSGPGYYNSTDAAIHYAFMKEIGVTKLRMPFANPTYPEGVTTSKQAMTEAVAEGFRVIAVAQPRNGDDAGWAVSRQDILDAAEFCYNYGIPEINMGNELEYRNMTNMIDKYIEVAGEIQVRWPSLIKSVAMAQSKLEYLGAPNGYIERAAEIIAAGIIPGYNVYGDNGNTPQFMQRILDLKAVFPNLYITEWNLNNEFANFPSSIITQNAVMEERLNFLMDQEIEHYFFNFFWSKNNDRFALLKANDEWREWYKILLKLK